MNPNYPEYYHAVLERITPRSTPVFESPEMQERVWGRRWGARSEVSRLRMVLVHRPGEEMTIMRDDHFDPELGALIHDDDQWYYRNEKAPDLARMQAQHDGLTAVLRQHGVEVVYTDGPPHDPKAVFTRDCGIAVDGGIIICRMGPVGRTRGGRRGEEAYVTRTVAALGMPILHTIHGDGLLEGGSFVWLDQSHAAIGMAYRQNESGVRQLEYVLREHGVELIRVDLTGHSLHLDGCITLVHHDLALINVTRLPYWFLDTLKRLNIRAVHVHPEEWQALNCLAVEPGKVITSMPCERTAERLSRHGVVVIPVEYDEIRRNGGGVRCSTCPLIRDIT